MVGCEGRRLLDASVIQAGPPHRPAVHSPTEQASDKDQRGLDTTSGPCSPGSRVGSPLARSVSGLRYNERQGVPLSQVPAGPVGYTHHLQEGEVTQTHVVIVDLDVEPADLSRVHQALALRLVVDLRDVEPLRGGGVDAVVELAGKQVDAHDAEDEPENEADEQHVHDGGDGSQEGIHHHLGAGEGVIARSPPRQGADLLPEEMAPHLH